MRRITLVACLVWALSCCLVQGDRSSYGRVKVLGFKDPKTGSMYRVTSFNATRLSADSNYRSVIRVSRSEQPHDRAPGTGHEETIQTIQFNPTLVDFDLECSDDFCFMVAVSSRSKQNVELYRWQRTQFDLVAKRDSFSRAHSVQLIQIQSDFYIAVAQEQLHLVPQKLNQDTEEHTRFIGCAILKFSGARATQIKYHQFIRLPYHPLHVNYFSSYDSNNQSSSVVVQPNRNHYLVFSLLPDWTDTKQAQSHAYIWSPLNDHFWPYRLPRAAEFARQPGPTGPVVTFPSLPQKMNFTQASDYVPPIESCFYQLQRLLADRDLEVKRLIESSKTVWRAQPQTYPGHQAPPTNITARVIVRGNVTVKGSVIQSPQVSLIAGRNPPAGARFGSQPELLNSHSPALVDDSLKRAFYKLKHVREKLLHAVRPGPNRVTTFKSPIRFHGPLGAERVDFGGVANSNVRLNGIPFEQLEHELVSLKGIQTIPDRVVFTGRVVADVLEIHALVNNQFFMKDAIDITSRRIQEIDASAQNYIQGLPAPLEFESVAVPALVLSPNATFNDIRLNDFIMRDNRTQIVHGFKSFRRLSMGRLDLAHPGVQLNGQNLSRLAQNAVRIRASPQKPYQTIFGGHVTFTKPILVDNLIINNVINQHINLSSLIYDSVKTNDISPQQISGHKNFMNGVRIARLTTDGSINDIKIDQVFNLNPLPPISDINRFTNRRTAALADIPIIGNVSFRSMVNIHGNLTVGLINGIDIVHRAIRRAPKNGPLASIGGNSSNIPQIVYGRKIFLRPLRVLDRIDLLNKENVIYHGVQPPLVNGLDVRAINAAISRQMQQPPTIYIQNLEIDGNLNLPSSTNFTNSSRLTMGNYTFCPLDLVRSRTILTGGEDQIIDIPLKVKSLRARSVELEPFALGGLSFPDDFVLRSPASGQIIEPVYGRKTFEQLIIVPSLTVPHNYSEYAARPSNHFQSSAQLDMSRRIQFEERASVNQINYPEIHDFIVQERQRNSTGEKVYNTMNVYGNIRAGRINGYHWPDDILLKSASSVRGPILGGPDLYHKRIYSPLIFLNTSFLEIENQLVLRGPIHMHGKVNGINLTDFARQSATYGDKDLMLTTRPLRNKIFLAGVTVTGEIRSQGLIDGVNFDEMKARAITINAPNSRPMFIRAPKAFLSDIVFSGPIRANYLNDLPLDNYLRSLRFEPDGVTIRVSGKKTITGALRARNLIVRGTINGINFEDLKARAITLAPNRNEIQFNKTLTIEGDVFMDNLLVDEKTGMIDGLQLNNLLPRKQPMSIMYEQQAPLIRHPTIAPIRNQVVTNHIETLRDKMIPMQLLPLNSYKDLVAGFIYAPQTDLGGYSMPDEEPSHVDHIINQHRSLLQLDQIDFPFRPTTFRLSVAIETNRDGRNITTVLSSVKDGPLDTLTILPIEWPNNAMFLRVADALFLLISQDYTRFRGRNPLCPSFGGPASALAAPNLELYDSEAGQIGDGGIHVYLFHALQNSSSLASAYFDLYQTIDLPSVDSFVNFNYRGSTYVLTVSRALGRIHLLLLRGYSGFQVVSYVDAPMVESVRVISTGDKKPALIIYLSNGMHRLMESVVI